MNQMVTVTTRMNLSKLNLSNIHHTGKGYTGAKIGKGGTIGYGYAATHTGEESLIKRVILNANDPNEDIKIIINQ